MRVTLVTETFAPQVNGVSRTLGQLVRVLRESGDVVQVIHPDYGEPAESGNLAVKSIRAPFYRELHLPIPPFGRVHRAIDTFKPDLMHVATEAMLGYTALRFGLSRGLPVVSSFHTNFDQYTHHYGVGWARGLAWRYMRWFHNLSAETYVPSMATIHELSDRGFERLVLWPRGVDGSTFRPDRSGRQSIRDSMGIGPEDIVIGHVGRLAAEKNVDYLGNALAIVVEARPSVRILIVGDGPSRASLETRLGSSAIFAGYRSGGDLADHYSAADLFAFASKTETFGNVVLEAMSSGLPVVALRAGGPGEVVRDGITGLLLDPDAQPSNFAEALIGLVDDATRRRSLAASARDYALTQTWEAIMGGLRARYLDLVREAPTLPTESGARETRSRVPDSR